MSGERRAVRTLVVVAILAIPLAVASIAFACARLSTLKLNRTSGPPGAQASAIGRNYNFDARSSAVTLRFNSRRGPVLWEGRADSRGRIRGAFRIPNARPGQYVILATQTSEGRPVAGTPGRAPLRISGARRSSAASAATPPPAGGAGPQAGGPPALPSGLAPGLLLLGLGLAAGGGAFVLTVRRRTSARSS
jgi:hypothetical protein